MKYRTGRLMIAIFILVANTRLEGIKGQSVTDTKNAERAREENPVANTEMEVERHRSNM